MCNHYIFTEYIILRANRSVFAHEVLVVWNEKKPKAKEAVYTLPLQRKVLVPIWRSMMDYTAVKKMYIHRINYHNIVSNVCAHIKCAFGTFYISNVSVNRLNGFLGPQCLLFVTCILFVPRAFYSFWKYSILGNGLLCVRFSEVKLTWTSIFIISIWWLSVCVIGN